MTEIESELRALLKTACPPLIVSKEKADILEVSGTKEVMQGKQKVQGHYFASIVPKPKDTRLYFFPIYTHPNAFKLSSDLQKMLKGKSCFHINKLDKQIKAELKAMINKGLDLYQNDQLI